MTVVFILIACLAQPAQPFFVSPDPPAVCDVCDMDVDDLQPVMDSDGPGAAKVVPKPVRQKKGEGAGAGAADKADAPTA